VRERFQATISECAALVVSGSDEEVAAAMSILNMLMYGSTTHLAAKPKPTKTAKRPNT
jgi:hypothetical protein